MNNIYVDSLLCDVPFMLQKKLDIAIGFYCSQQKIYSLVDDDVMGTDFSRFPRGLLLVPNILCDMKMCHACPCMQGVLGTP